jgi:hypothetical protein
MQAHAGAAKAAIGYLQLLFILLRAARARLELCNEVLLTGFQELLD